MRVTADDVRELLTCSKMDPTLLRWEDTGEVEVVAGPLLTDVSYCHRNRPYAIIMTANDLGSLGSDWDPENPTDADCEAWAETLNTN